MAGAVHLHFDLAPGVHGIEHAHTNCYIIADDDGVTLVDAAFPTTASAVLDVLSAIGRTTQQIGALLLTHGHFDHVGFAARAQRQLDVPVWVHEADRRLARHPYRYRPERNRLLFPVQQPQSWPLLAHMVLAGALTVRGVEADRTFAGGQVLAVPGQPIVVHAPGHTAGESAFWFPHHDMLVTGDALVTLDPYTGARGPRLVAPAATADSDQALASLDRLAEVDARLVLPGHGPAWHRGSRSAVQIARRAPARYHG